MQKEILHIARGVVLSSFAFLVALIFASSVHAAPVFFDDFEDGDANGWSVFATGSGSTGVEVNNGSMRAFAAQTQSGQNSLSRDFSYADDSLLSFEMQVIANPSTGAESSGGVRISFLNSFNIEIDSLSFVNSTDGALPANGFFIDETLNQFSNTMANFAAFGGLNDTSAVATMSLEFFAEARRSACCFANSKVWFDNVTVSAVPVPAAAWLFGSGLLGLIGVAKRKKAA